MNKQTEERLRDFIEKTVLLTPALLLNRRRHAFYGLRTIGLPHRISFELTDRCNLACLECPHRLSKTTGTRDLDPQIFQNLIDEYAPLIKAYNVPQHRLDIMFDGVGEPTLSPYFSECISFLHRKLPEARSILFTNGVELDEQLARMIAGRVKLIIFNMNGATPDSYATNMGKNMFEQARRNILRFIEIRNNSGTTTPSITLQLARIAPNFDTFRRFKEYWQAKLSPGDEVIIKAILHNWGGKVNVNGLAQGTKPKKQQPCYHPWQTVSINCRGEFLLCPLAWETGPESLLNLGSLKGNDSFKTLYQSNTNLSLLRNMHLSGRFEFAAEPCQNCTLPFYLHTPFFRWPKVFGGKWF